MTANWPNASLLINNKDFKEKVDSMDAVEQDVTLSETCNESAVLQLHHLIDLYYVPMKPTFI